MKKIVTIILITLNVKKKINNYTLNGTECDMQTFFFF
jgi:hypothetical protein